MKHVTEIETRLKYHKFPEIPVGIYQAVCALVSLSIMGGTQYLIICVKLARSEHLAGSDCGDEYSINTL